MIEIHESSWNKTSRIFFIFFSIFFMVFGALHSLVFLVCRSYFAVPGIMAFLFGFYFFGHMAKLVSISPETLVFKKRSKSISVKFSDIKSIRMVNTFTFTDQYWMVIYFYDAPKQRSRRFFFMSEPQFFTLQTFKGMGFPVKSIW